MLLSVIIPVYKVEKYLQRCVQSVASQSFSELEIILVDDCSPDSCGSICDRLAQADKRIRVIHRAQNGGLSAARNSGIEIASGDYITFLDSDDFIAPDTYAANLKILEATNADCVEFPVKKLEGNAEKYYAPVSDSYNTESFEDWIARQGYVHGYAWNKIFRRELWGATRFPVGKYFEDLHTVPYVLHQAGTIAVSSSGCYYYCTENANAITQTSTLQKHNDLLDANIKLFLFLRNDCRFAEERLYNLFMEMLDRQIEVARAGGEIQIPCYKLRFKYLKRRQSARRRIKAALWLTFGKSAFFKLLS